MLDEPELVAEVRAQLPAGLGHLVGRQAQEEDRVARLGTTSVRYEVGLFRNDEEEAAAAGHFVHVYVDRATTRPTPLPDTLRHALEPLLA